MAELLYSKEIFTMRNVLRIGKKTGSQIPRRLEEVKKRINDAEEDWSLN